MSEAKEVGDVRATSLFGLLTIKDIIAVLSVAVSLALAWGVFSTRITLIEHQMVQYRDELKQNAGDVRIMSRAIQQLERSTLEDRFILDELYHSVKGSNPRRLAPDRYQQMDR